MAESRKKIQIRTSDGVIELIKEFQRFKRSRFESSAVRLLIADGLEKPEPSPPYYERYRDADSRARRKELAVDFSVHERVDAYRAEHDLTYEEAYMEFLLRGLEAWKGAPIDPA